jgi:hypothetical protein
MVNANERVHSLVFDSAPWSAPTSSQAMEHEVGKKIYFSQKDVETTLARRPA